MCAMNRKEFIVGGAGAFFIASAGKAFGADAPSNRVRLALVGCREKGRGAAVVQRALQVPGVEIAYVCDVDSRAMDYAADLVEKKSNGASRPKKEKDLRKILDDPSVDGILSETPDHFHAWSAVMAMRAGKAVYVEKPCAFCPREGEIILPAPLVSAVPHRGGVGPEGRTDRQADVGQDVVHDASRADWQGPGRG